MPFQPALYRIKVKPDPVEERSAGGIVIPTSTKEKEQLAAVTGTVVAVGVSAFEGKQVVKPGDRILYAKYGGLVFEEGGHEYRFLNDDDLIAVES